jgi:Undecaprenyl-phosphate glucose phosphotransferase
MILRRTQPLAVWFQCCDLVLTAGAWVGAYFLRFSGLFPIPKDCPEFALCERSLPLVAVLAAVAFRLTGQYQVHRLRRLREETAAICKGAALLSLLVMATTFFRHDPYESRLTMLLFTLLTAGSLLAARRITWSALKQLRRSGYDLSNALVVGTGRVARRTARGLQHAGWMGIRIVGFVEDNPSRWTRDLRVVGRIAELPDLVERHGIEHVFIALPLGRHAEARRVFDTLAESFVDVRLVLDVPDLAGLSLTTSNLDGLPLIGLRESPHFGLNLFVKRLMDIVLSAIGLLILAPLFAALAVIIKRTSAGPVFYRQERCGLNGKPFPMLKFRTMRVDAENTTGPVWAIKDDPRRTWFGGFLRRTSLDELPQLINVLRGEMSLVGPRPERPVFIHQFKRTIPNYMARHCVKAGITGWAQVHGWRGNTSLRKRLQFDLYYITHWTPLLDIRILFLTLFRGLVNRNAY